MCTKDFGSVTQNFPFSVDTEPSGVHKVSKKFPIELANFSASFEDCGSCVFSIKKSLRVAPDPVRRCEHGMGVSRQVVNGNRGIQTPVPIKSNCAPHASTEDDRVTGPVKISIPTHDPMGKV